MNEMILISIFFFVAMATIVTAFVFMLRYQKEHIVDLSNRLMARDIKEFAAIQKQQLKPKELFTREPISEKETKPIDPVLGGKY